MVNKSRIVRNLEDLDKRYNGQSRNPRDPLYFSRLALMELCGGIEITMDSIIEDCARKHLSNSKNMDYLKTTIIQRTYAFDYLSFRRMLMQVVGLIKVEELEGMLDSTKFTQMKSSLGSLKKQRDKEAHTYISGITPSLFAPSAINNHFQIVYDGLKDMEHCIRRIRF